MVSIIVFKLAYEYYENYFQQFKIVLHHVYFQVTGIQCLSGTGSLREGADFLNYVCKMNTVYISKPSW